ncbi:hypothetical protein LshimejAT787_0406860 [Lyophyllum shimeji]|uniref:Uncharacterized protein n=1 Tax=Lyophyllum shimeji TaxID=47721 RepID=A0A9P3PK03_LYOSH|nr:hypothetical protein LshimejAT787_0406860 [Lyophyllum shimeji]
MTRMYPIGDRLNRQVQVISIQGYKCTVPLPFDQPVNLQTLRSRMSISNFESDDGALVPAPTAAQILD